MADVLRLADHQQTTTVDLLDGTFKLVSRSWTSSTPQPTVSYEPVPYGAIPSFDSFPYQVEIMELIARTASSSTVRAGARDIYDALEGARLYNQHPRWMIPSGGALPSPNAWWLEWNVDGEPTRRTLIYDGSYTMLTRCGISPMLETSTAHMQLSLTRHPFWESTSTTAKVGTSVSGFGGTTTQIGVYGDVPARLRYFQIEGNSATRIYRAWWGIREEMRGYSNFEPIWELEDGQATGGAGTSSDGSESGTGYIRVSTLTTSLTRYAYMTVNDVCVANSHTNYEHQFGEYLVLCRCRVDAGTVGLQMRQGYRYSEVTTPSEEVFIDNTSWRLIELGHVQIPPMTTENLDLSYARYYMIEIYAEQVSGTTTALDLDALCFIPTHHMWYMNAVDIRDVAGTKYNAVGGTSPNDRQLAWGERGAYPTMGAEFSFSDWYVPVGDSIGVFAGEGQTAHVLTNTVDTYLQYYPRWAMYAETSGT